MQHAHRSERIWPADSGTQQFRKGLVVLVSVLLGQPVSHTFHSTTFKILTVCVRAKVDTQVHTHIYLNILMCIYIYVILCDAGQHVCTCLGMQISLRVSFSTCMSVCLPACQPAYPPPICLRRSCQRLRGSAAKLLNRAVRWHFTRYADKDIVSDFAHHDGKQTSVSVCYRAHSKHGARGALHR